MNTETRDVIDLLAGIEPGSSLDAIRRRRLQARENAQRSYLALFEPREFDHMLLTERYAVAAFVAGLHGEPAAADFYLTKLSKIEGSQELVETLEAEIERGKTKGPYGAFPAGPLSTEDKTGLIYRLTEGRKSVISGKLAAALEHAHLLVFRPRDAKPADMQMLLDAGWSSTGIVVLSQLVAFLSFQVRAVVGLRTLGASLAVPAQAAAKAS